MRFLQRVKNIELFIALTLLWFDITFSFTPFNWRFRRRYSWEGPRIGPFGLDVGFISNTELDA